MASLMEEVPCQNLPETDKGNMFQKVRKRIEDKFDSVIQKVVERRDALLLQLDKWEQEYEKVNIKIFKYLQELDSEKFEMEQLLNSAKGETAKSSLIRGIDQLATKIIESNKKAEIPELTFNFESNDVEWRISQLGVLINSNKIETPPGSRDYTRINGPLKLFGKFGSLRGEFNSPRGMFVDDTHRRIFIADMQNSRVQVWTMDGEYICAFGKGTFVQPWGIVMCDNFLFVSDFEGNFLTKWFSDGFNLKTKSLTTRGSNPGKLNQPSGLDISDGEIFVVESGNYRISVFDLDLNFKRVMSQGEIRQAFCLRVRNNTIYIMERTGILKLFSKTGKLTNTLLENVVFFSASFIFDFNFDSDLNFLISDNSRNCVVVVSPIGTPIHAIYFRTWKLEQPFGVSTTEEGNIVTSFQKGISSCIAMY